MIMLKSVDKSVLDSWFHTDHKHGARLWLNKVALLEQSNSGHHHVRSAATEARDRHLPNQPPRFYKGHQETHNFKALLFH